MSHTLDFSLLLLLFLYNALTVSVKLIIHNINVNKSLVKNSVVNFILINDIYQWCSGKALDLRPIGRGFNSHPDKAA